MGWLAEVDSLASSFELHDLAKRLRVDDPCVRVCACVERRDKRVSEHVESTRVDRIEREVAFIDDGSGQWDESGDARTNIASE